MTAIGVWGYAPAPEDPLRRVFWVVPLAVALVLLAMLGIGRLLRAGAGHEPAPLPPVQVRIYELPGVPGPVPAPEIRGQVGARPAPVPRAPIPAAPPRRERRARTRAPLPHRRGPRLHAVAGLRVPASAAPDRSESVPAPPPRRQIDWTHLSQQIDAAVASAVTEAEFPRVRDPNSLVARYYLASVLRKLERVGEMTYLGTMVGEASVVIVIGPNGDLDALQLWNSSGNAQLDEYAQRIVRLSAPFGPFPESLERETMQLKLTVRMLFEGFREVEAR